MRADDVKRVAVIGAGTMGNGIVQVFAHNGASVVMIDAFPYTCGNTTTYPVTLHVEDTTGPVVTPPGDVTVECGAVPEVGTTVSQAGTPLTVKSWAAGSLLTNETVSEAAGSPTWAARKKVLSVPPQMRSTLTLCELAPSPPSSEMVTVPL